MAPAREVKRGSRRRFGLPTVAVVGYTNAGKSSLTNRLTGSAELVENALFATLDTAVRRAKTRDGRAYAYVDTVGFVRRLPTQLVEAFKATLEELEYADLLLHVIDISDPHWLEQAQIVDELIEELGAQQIPCLRVYNKSDLYFGDIRPHGEDSVNISAKTGEGVTELLNAIVEQIPAPIGDPAAPARALIFDSVYDAYRGVVTYIRVVDGAIKHRDRILMMSTNATHEVLEVGVISPEPKPGRQLSVGEVGYLITGVKDVRQSKVGDTITTARKPATQALAGYTDPKPMVFSGVYPIDGSDYAAW